MKRFALATAVSSARQLLALVVLVVAFINVGYIGLHPMGQSCWVRPMPPVHSIPPDTIIVRHPACRPSRAAWQIPATGLLGLAGVGAAAVVAGLRRPSRRLPDGVSEGRLARI